MSLTTNFNKSEFECKCGCKMPDDVFINIQKLASQLQYIRDVIKLPISLTNAYRCPEHNKEVGGVANSQHILGKAADLQVAGYKPSTMYKIIDVLIEDGCILQGGLGLYPTFVHYDIRKTRARWNKTKN